MRGLIQSALRRLRSKFYSKEMFAHYPHELLKSHTDEKVAQILLRQCYQTAAALPDRRLSKLSYVGFRQYSEFEEDGILLYLFSLIPPRSRICVELCSGDGIECNAANL